jgi:hypothetical protein
MGMRIGYDALSKRYPLWAKHLLIIAGVVALPVAVRFDSTASAKPNLVTPMKPAKQDARTLRLTNFLARLHCPVANMAEDFVHAADDNHLDWRLLPSIAVIESGGGKAYKGNNIFGWNGGEEVFPTIRAGLNQVAYRLGRSPIYQHRDSLQKLLLYNPSDTYADMVLNVMRRISPIDPRPSVETVIFRKSEYVYATN